MIYIVEDDSNISELVVYTLKMAGFDAQSFTCGTELFKQLENNIPELILLDIMARNMIRLQVLTAVPMIMLQSPLV